MPTFLTNPDPPDPLNISDAALVALSGIGWIGALRLKRSGERLEPIPDRAPPSYTPTLPGVSYDSTQNRLVASFSKRRRSYYIGSGPPTRETEERLHRQWMALRAELENE